MTDVGVLHDEVASRRDELVVGLQFGVGMLLAVVRVGDNENARLSFRDLLYAIDNGSTVLEPSNWRTRGCLGRMRICAMPSVWYCS